MAFFSWDFTWKDQHIRHTSALAFRMPFTNTRMNAFESTGFKCQLKNNLFRFGQNMNVPEQVFTGHVQSQRCQQTLELSFQPTFNITTRLYSKSNHSPFFSFGMLTLHFTKPSCPNSSCLANGQWAICVCQQLYINKVAADCKWCRCNSQVKL